MANAPISIDYDLGEHGWSKFTLTVGDESVRVGAFSYCTDALGDLVRAALAIAAGAYRADVSFELEPGEQRLVVSRQYNGGNGSTPCDISLLEFENFSYPFPADSQGRLVFQAIVTVEAFTRSVADFAQTLWDRYGIAEYNALWMGPRGFPLSALRALQCALEIKDPPPYRSEPDDFVFTTGLERRETDD